MHKTLGAFEFSTMKYSVLNEYLTILHNQPKRKRRKEKNLPPLLRVNLRAPLTLIRPRNQKVIQMKILRSGKRNNARKIRKSERRKRREERNQKRKGWC